MPSSSFDYERFATACAQDTERWDILKCSINNLRFTVPLATTIKVGPSEVANLPGIAARYLGSRFLWFAILHYNGLYDSINDVKVGMTLNIPQLEPLLTALKNQSAASASGNTNNLVVI